MLNFDTDNPLIALCASTSRIVQLQSTSYTKQSRLLQPIVTKPENGKYIALAQQLLDTLVERASSGETGYISLSVLNQQLSTSEYTVDVDELKLTAKFLAQDGVFYYSDETGSSKSTRNLTKLLDYQARSERVRLTSASRLLYRITSSFKDWMFEDKEVEKITRAIKVGEYHRVPKLVENNIIMFRSLNEEITRMYESSDYDELAAAYFERRQVYQDTLMLSQEAARNAIILLSGDDVRADIEYKNGLNPDANITPSILAAHINELIAAVEALSRNFTELIKLLQKPREYRLGIIDFKVQAELFTGSTLSEDVLTSWTNSHFGWQLPAHIHSALDFSKSLIIPVNEDKSVVISIDLNDKKDAILSWVEQHREQIITQLKSGAKPLHWLINNFNRESTLEHMDDIFDLFTTSFKECKLVDGITIKVNRDCQHTIKLNNGSNIRVSDITLSAGEAS